MLSLFLPKIKFLYSLPTLDKLHYVFIHINTKLNGQWIQITCLVFTDTQ